MPPYIKVSYEGPGTSGYRYTEYRIVTYHTEILALSIVLVVVVVVIVVVHADDP